MRAEPKIEIVETAPRAPLWHRGVAFVLKAAVPILILAAALYAAEQIYSGGPEAERREPKRVARLVDHAVVAPAERGPVIEAWGEVVPARVLALRPEIGGRVAWVSPALVAGGAFDEGDEILRIDTRQADLALTEAEAAADEIRAEIRLEEGQAARANADLNRGSPLRLTEAQRELVLRKPQMRQLEARLAAAMARIETARIDLEKAVIRAPFEAVVLTTELAEGAVIQSGTEIARLAAADRFEIRLALPPTALGWVTPGEGAEARLSQPGIWAEDQGRTASLDRFGADLTEAGRMVELYATVGDPLSRDSAKGQPPLLLGSYLRAEIAGRAVPGAVRIDRAALRDDDTVWVIGPEKRLEIRPVEIAWRGAEEVLITKGLAAGDRIVTTHLAVVASGMRLRLKGERGGGPAPQ